MNRHSIRTVPVALAALVLLPGGLLAQTCLGVPTFQRQTALQASVVFDDDITAWGGDIRPNLPGALSIGIGGQITDDDRRTENIRQVRADFSLEAGDGEFGVCPVVGASYSSWKDDFLETTLELSELRVPVGLGLGMRLEVGRTAVLIPSALLGGYWYRLRDGVELNGTAVRERETGTEFFGDAGVTLGLGQLYVRGSMLGDSRDDAETRYRVTLGLVF